MGRRPSIGAVLRGFVAVLLFTAGMTPAFAWSPPTPAAAGAHAADPFKFSVSTVSHGQTSTVDVTAAPCDYVTVTVIIDGVTVSSERIRVGGSSKFFAPYDSSGQIWTVLIECDSGTATGDAGLVH